MNNFRTVDRETGFLLPPSVDEWLPQKHLARFVVEVIDGLDLRAMSASYRGSGSASYPPSLLLGLLVYGYATGVFSSRKLERATYDSVAFRFLGANEHPDHDTIAAFRRRFLKEIEGLFVQVLELAREMGLLQMGTVALDGTKVHANASRHSALSYEHAGRIEAQLKAEVADLMAKAEAADRADIPDGLSIPDELARREERLHKLAEARATIEARARERFEREQADYQARMAVRDAKAAATGQKPRGKPPRPPGEGPRPMDQINLTDEESRIMPVAGGGFAALPFGSSSATMPRPWSRRAAYWWSPPMWSKLPTTSSSSRRCWASSPPCPRTWASPRPCWPTTAISARPTWRLARRPGSSH
jgi:transposase